MSATETIKGIFEGRGRRTVVDGVQGYMMPLTPGGISLKGTPESFYSVADIIQILRSQSGLKMPDAEPETVAAEYSDINMLSDTLRNG